VDIRQIDWTETIAVRHNVLWPNKPPEFCHLQDDHLGIHFGGFVDELLVCVASIYIENGQARLRKYATEAEYQGQGIGSAVLNKIIVYLQERKIGYFWCDARESALSFYQRFGMLPSGERFYKSEVAYYKVGMVLALQ
jgi:ribosomal protein S18 acetylase RimI-like enzyme